MHSVFFLNWKEFDCFHIFLFENKTIWFPLKRQQNPPLCVFFFNINILNINLLNIHQYSLMAHTEKYFRNLIKSNWNQVVYFPINLEQQTDTVRLLFQNQSVCIVNTTLISVWFNKDFSEIFLCVYDRRIFFLRLIHLGVMGVVPLKAPG